MPRSLRQIDPGAFAHVIARGNARQDIFTGQPMCERFLRLLLLATRRSEAKLHAYCLMTNHVHLLIETGRAPLGRLMHQLLFRFAQYFNRRHESSGHVFQDRYRSILCDSDAHLLTLIRYIHRNPVRAGIVREPEEWPWSSHRAYLGERSPLVDPSYCLSLFGPDRDPRVSYKKFVEARAETTPPYARRERPRPSTPFVRKPQSQPKLPALGPQLEDFATGAKTTVSEIQGGSKTPLLVSLRRQFAIEAHAAGYSFTDISKSLGLSKQAVHYLTRAEPARILTEF